MRRRSSLLIAPRQVRWVEDDLPSPSPDEAIVRTRAGAVSVGTEIPIFCGTHRGDSPFTSPKMTGYESVGEIIVCGTNVQRLKMGDRVIAFYGHRTHAVLSADRAIRIPPDIGDAISLLAILGCHTAKGIAKVNPQNGQKVIRTGAGTIGLLTLVNLKAHAIDQIDVVEPLAYRRELARELGANRVVAPNEAYELEATYHVGFECSSRNQAFCLLQNRMANGGRICILADGNIEPLMLTPAFHAKELEIVRSSDGQDHEQYALWFFAQLRRKRPPLEKLYERETTSEMLPHVFRQIARGWKITCQSIGPLHRRRRTSGCSRPSLVYAVLRLPGPAHARH
jgi:alcohol dehydrogenase